MVLHGLFCALCLGQVFLMYVVLLWMNDGVFIFFPFQTVCCVWPKRTLALSCKWISSVLFI